MADHTPTPWHVSPDSTMPFYIAAPDKGMTAFVGKIPISMQTGRKIQEDEANAAFIVKAVNNHDALVKHLHHLATICCDEDALGLLDSLNGDGPDVQGK